MKVKTIFYDMRSIPQSKKVIVKRKLFGYNDHSNKGDYKYKREGLLAEIKHFRPAKATIITEPKDCKKIIGLLEKYNVIYLVIDSDIPASYLKN